MSTGEVSGVGRGRTAFVSGIPTAMMAVPYPSEPSPLLGRALGRAGGVVSPEDGGWGGDGSGVHGAMRGMRSAALESPLKSSHQYFSFSPDRYADGTPSALSASTLSRRTLLSLRRSRAPPDPRVAEHIADFVAAQKPPAMHVPNLQSLVASKGGPGQTPPERADVPESTSAVERTAFAELATLTSRPTPSTTRKRYVNPHADPFEALERSALPVSPRKSAGGRASAPKTKGRHPSAFPSRSAPMRAVEAIKYRNETTVWLMDVNHSVHKLLDMLVDGYSQRLECAMRLDPPHIQRQSQASGTQCLVQPRANAREEQLDALRVFSSTVQDLVDASTELVATYLTKEEKRFLGVNTHRYQSKRERQTAYQYMQESCGASEKSSRALPRSTGVAGRYNNISSDHTGDGVALSFDEHSREEHAYRLPATQQPIRESKRSLPSHHDDCDVTTDSQSADERSSSYSGRFRQPPPQARTISDASRGLENAPSRSLTADEPMTAAAARPPPEMREPGGPGRVELPDPASMVHPESPVEVPCRRGTPLVGSEPPADLGTGGLAFASPSSSSTPSTTLASHGARSPREPSADSSTFQSSTYQSSDCGTVNGSPESANEGYSGAASESLPRTDEPWQVRSRNCGPEVASRPWRGQIYRAVEVPIIQRELYGSTTLLPPRRAAPVVTESAPARSLSKPPPPPRRNSRRSLSLRVPVAAPAIPTRSRSSSGTEGLQRIPLSGFSTPAVTSDHYSSMVSEDQQQFQKLQNPREASTTGNPALPTVPIPKRYDFSAFAIDSD